MSCKLSKGGISQPPGPEEETVDMAELLNGKVLEAGNTPSYHGRADSKKTTISKYSDAEQFKTKQDPGASSDYLGNMNRTQYDGLIAQSAYERRMQIGKTSTLPIPKLGDQSQVESPLAAASQVVRNQALSSTRSLQKIYHNDIGLPMTSSKYQSHIQKPSTGLRPEITYGERPATQQPSARMTKTLREKLADHEKNFNSTAPKTVIHPSTITEKDIDMACKHIMYKTMTPTEKIKQDEWANKLFDMTTPCPDRYTWEPAADGYQCKGGKHFITHLLVQELKQGLFIVPYGSPIRETNGAINKTNKDNSRGYIKTRWGPYYPHPDYVKVFMYSGPTDKPIPHGCPVTQGGDPSPEDANEPNEEHRGQILDKRLQLWLQFCVDNKLEFSMELNNGSKGRPKVGPAKEAIVKQIIDERAKLVAKITSKAAAKPATESTQSSTQVGRRAQSFGGNGTRNH